MYAYMLIQSFNHNSVVLSDLPTQYTTQITTNYGMKYAKEVQKMVQAREERPVQGLLEQWLREGKMDEHEAVMTSTSMFTAGVDSVSIEYIILYFVLGPQFNQIILLNTLVSTNNNV